MRIKLTPHQLSAFLRLAQTLNFGDAAAEMGISQPGLSRIIRSMETALDMRLFDRDTRNIVLTPIGHELMPIAERLVAEFDTAFGELAQFAQGQRGRIVIAALPSVAAIVLPAAIARFKRDWPDVDFKIHESLSETVQADVRDGRADLGVAVRGPLSDRLVWAPLVSDELVLVCRQDSPLADKPAYPWSVFESHPFVAMSPNSSVRKMTDAAFTQAGLSVRPLYECTQLATVGNLIREGLGVTALPRLALTLTGTDALVTRELSRPVMVRDIGVVTRLGRSLPPAAKQFLQVLMESARKA